MNANFLHLQAKYDQFDSEVRQFWKKWANLSKKKRKLFKKEINVLLCKWAISTMLHRDIMDNVEKYGDTNVNTT